MLLPEKIDYQLRSEGRTEKRKDEDEGLNTYGLLKSDHLQIKGSRVWG